MLRNMYATNFCGFACIAITTTAILSSVVHKVPDAIELQNRLVYNCLTLVKSGIVPDLEMKFPPTSKSWVENVRYAFIIYLFYFV